MSQVLAPVETAFSFLDVLKQTDAERDEIDVHFSGEALNGVAQEVWDATARIRRMAHAVWVSRLVDLALLNVLEATFKDTQLVVRRNAFAGTVSLVTLGAMNDRRSKVMGQWRESEERSDGQFATVSSQVFAEMAREGIVEWSMRTSMDEGYEVRRCPQCAKWFEPSLKSRSHFCSDKCPKTFNNRRTNDELNTFECAGVSVIPPMDDFAGLTLSAKYRNCNAASYG